MTTREQFYLSNEPRLHNCASRCAQLMSQTNRRFAPRRCTPMLKGRSCDVVTPSYPHKTAA